MDKNSTTDETTFGNKEQLTEILVTAAQEDRMVVEFQKRGDELYAIEITEHVEKLEAQNAE